MEKENIEDDGSVFILMGALTLFPKSPYSKILPEGRTMTYSLQRLQEKRKAIIPPSFNGGRKTERLFFPKKEKIKRMHYNWSDSVHARSLILPFYAEESSENFRNPEL